MRRTSYFYLLVVSSLILIQGISSEYVRQHQQSGIRHMDWREESRSITSDGRSLDRRTSTERGCNGLSRDVRRTASRTDSLDRTVTKLNRFVEDNLRVDTDRKVARGADARLVHAESWRTVTVASPMANLAQARGRCSSLQGMPFEIGTLRSAHIRMREIDSRGNRIPIDRQTLKDDERFKRTSEFSQGRDTEREVNRDVLRRSRTGTSRRDARDSLHRVNLERHSTRYGNRMPHDMKVERSRIDPDVRQRRYMVGATHTRDITNQIHARSRNKRDEMENLRDTRGHRNGIETRRLSSRSKDIFDRKDQLRESRDNLRNRIETRTARAIIMQRMIISKDTRDRRDDLVSRKDIEITRSTSVFGDKRRDIDRDRTRQIDSRPRYTRESLNVRQTKSTSPTRSVYVRNFDNVRIIKEQRRDDTRDTTIRMNARSVYMLNRSEQMRETRRSRNGIETRTIRDSKSVRILENTRNIARQRLDESLENTRQMNAQARYIIDRRETMHETRDSRNDLQRRSRRDTDSVLFDKNTRSFARDLRDRTRQITTRSKALLDRRVTINGIRDSQIDIQTRIASTKDLELFRNSKNTRNTVNQRREITRGMTRNMDTRSRDISSRKGHTINRRHDIGTRSAKYSGYIHNIHYIQTGTETRQGSKHMPSPVIYRYRNEHDMSRRYVNRSTPHRVLNRMGSLQRDMPEKMQISRNSIRDEPTEKRARRIKERDTIDPVYVHHITKKDTTSLRIGNIAESNSVRTKETLPEVINIRIKQHDGWFGLLSTRMEQLRLDDISVSRTILVGFVGILGRQIWQKQI